MRVEKSDVKVYHAQKTHGGVRKFAKQSFIPPSLVHDPRGSNWRKWDLHVHTPASIIQHYGPPNDETWEVFIADLESLPEEFSVIGINDYIFLDGYRRVLEYKQAGRLKNMDLILPVIELRVEHWAGVEKWKNINYHVLFSDQIDPDHIQGNFINGLFNSKTLGRGVRWAGLPTHENLEDYGRKIAESAPPEEAAKATNLLKIGFENIDFAIDDIDELLTASCFEEKFLTGIGKAEWSQISFGTSIGSKPNYIENVGFVFTAAPSVQGYQKSLATLKRQRINDRLLDCSDAHNLSTANLEQNCIGQSFTWIKADPTFMGLRHALVEFDERVYVGEMPPKLGSARDNATHFIDGVTFRVVEGVQDRGWFEQTGFVPFNQGLVSIIGNQGSGKSALSDATAMLGGTQYGEYFSFLNPDKFTNPRDKLARDFEGELSWASGDSVTRSLGHVVAREESELVRYVPQQFFEKICNDISRDDNPFEKQLRKVIFSHIPMEDRHGCRSLEELWAYWAAEVESTIAQYKIKINELNKDILLTQDAMSPGHRQKLENELTAKQKELSAIRKPDPVEKPPMPILPWWPRSRV